MNSTSEAASSAVAGAWAPLSEQPDLSRSPWLEPPLRLLLYFDIFDHPLTGHEIQALAYPPGLSWSEVKRALDALVKLEVLEHHADFYFLIGKRATVAARLDKAQHSRALWQKVPRSVRILAAFPFVRYPPEPA